MLCVLRISNFLLGILEFLAVRAPPMVKFTSAIRKTRLD